MSHFYGKLQGNRGEATRCGSKGGGLETVAASWRGCIRTIAYYDSDTDVDMVEVRHGTWQGVGQCKLIYDGPINPADQAKIDAAHAAKAAKRAEESCPITADDPPEHGLNPSTEEEAAQSC